VNWLTAFGLATMCLIAGWALLRVERRARWLVLVLLVAPGVLVLALWATIGRQWLEVLAGVGLALVVGGLWWLPRGRRLPPPSSDSIKVWGQEKMPKPKPGEVEAMQAELRRLREENEHLAAQIRTTRGNGGPKPEA
jgi:hypothetical protein